MLGGVVFAMFLVLTPRAWVDAENSPTQDQIPVEALEQNSDCLWCEPAPEDCEEGDTASAEDQEYWLNPDRPVPPSPALPCSQIGAKVPGA